ncbi:amidohydrolase [Cloacibacillus porcorum]|uniref:amidohydrolase n=1 Tax=Cloacibacillus porcorum TaxID=1197717 RepID=UPI002A80D38F|nr:amidohydrolase [Cloacibacillus porcorum]MDY4094299.1 amidohydrolase [Cloacibacillus porcorum]
MMAIPQKIKDEMSIRRRDFHKYPESGWAEFRTTAVIAGILTKAGWKVRFAKDFIDPDEVMGYTIDPKRERARAAAQGADKKILTKIGDYTGLTALLDTGKKGPVTIFRFDIDCVDTEEARDTEHLPAREGFASVNPGCMHACGHDGHAAVGLALAEMLSEAKDRLRGKIRLIFQPAEEGVRGGYAMSMAGVADDADYFIAMHLGLGKPTGSVFCGTGGFLCSTKFDADFRGVGAHAGGEPERGKNALLAAAAAAVNMHAIAPHSGGATRVNVGVLNAGEGRNVVPPNAHMKIETRGESDALASYVYAKAKEVIYGAAQMYDVDVSISKQGETITAESDRKLAAVIMKAAENSEGVTQREEYRAMAGSDDACWFMRRVQERRGLATYVGIGAATAAGHHNNRFDFDETAMIIALEVLLNSALLLNGEK